MFFLNDVYHNTFANGPQRRILAFGDFWTVGTPRSKYVGIPLIFLMQYVNEIFISSSISYLVFSSKLVSR